LGVGPEVAADELRSAWKVLVQVWHPDRFDGELREHAEAQTARINEAYHVLRDASRRTSYDDRLAYESGSSSRNPAAATSASVKQSTVSDPLPARPGAAGHPQAHAMGEVSALGALGDFARAFEEAARRYPRMVGALAACLLLLFGGGLIYAHTAGPQIPETRLAAAERALERNGSASPDDATMLHDVPTLSKSPTTDGSPATDGVRPRAPQWEPNVDSAIAPRETLTPAEADPTAAPRARNIPEPAPEPLPAAPPEPAIPGWQDELYGEPPPPPKRIIRVTPKRRR
jgi:hypothetical protein